MRYCVVSQSNIDNIRPGPHAYRTPDYTKDWGICVRTQADIVFSFVCVRVLFSFACVFADKNATT